MIRKIVSKPMLWVIPALLIGIIFTLIPFIKTIENSFTVHDNPYNNSITSIGIGNYKSVINDPRFTSSLMNSSLIILIVAPLTLIICFLIAYAISTISYKKFSNGILSIMFVQFFISSFAIGVVFMMLFGSKYNVINNIFGINVDWASSSNKFLPFLTLSFFYMWRVSAISIVLFVFGMNKINKKTIFIGKIDNLNFFQRIKYIYMTELKKLWILQIYIALAESLFLYPTIFENIYASNGQTILYYIIDQSRGNILSWNLASSASIIFIIYSISLFILVFIIPKVFMKIHRRIKHEK